MSIAFFIQPQGLLQYSKLCERQSLRFLHLFVYPVQFTPVTVYQVKFMLITAQRI